MKARTFEYLIGERVFHVTLEGTRKEAKEALKNHLIDIEVGWAKVEELTERNYLQASSHLLQAAGELGVKKTTYKGRDIWFSFPFAHIHAVWVGRKQQFRLEVMGEEYWAYPDLFSARACLLLCMEESIDSPHRNPSLGDFWKNIAFFIVVIILLILGATYQSLVK